MTAKQVILRDLKLSQVDEAFCNFLFLADPSTMAAFLVLPGTSVGRSLFFGKYFDVRNSRCIANGSFLIYGRDKRWRQAREQGWRRSRLCATISSQATEDCAGNLNTSAVSEYPGKAGMGSGGSGKLRKFSQISDVHIFDTDGVFQENAFNFVGQRFFGLMNILFFRGPDKYSMRVLQAAIKDMKEQGVQHIACVGDLTNLAIETEFKAAKQVFEAFGNTRSMTFLPGNHDVYSRGQARARLFQKHFGEYAVSDLKRLSPRGDGFPILQERGGVVFICLNSGRPNTARGTVGRRQWRAAREMLDTADGRHMLKEARLRVLLVHHPTQDPSIRALPWIRELGHDLKDWKEVPKFCKDYAIELCLHGHNHVPYSARMQGSEDTLIYEAGSGTMLVEDPERIARYNIYELDDNGKVARSYARVWNIEEEVFKTKELPIPKPGPPVPVGPPEFVRELVE